MKRKKGPRNPMEEGSLKEIYRWFLLPSLQYKPETTTINEWYENLFDVKNVEITQYRARWDFVLPGLYHKTPLVKIQGIGYRIVRGGQYLFVRTYLRDVDRVEVEFAGGVGEKSQLFTLTESEWNSIAANLEESK